MFWLSFRSLGGNDVLQLLLQLIRDDGECADRHLVVGDVLLLEVSAAGELVEIVARLHLGLHLAENGRRRMDALLGEADILCGNPCLVLGWPTGGHLVDGGTIAKEGIGLRGLSILLRLQKVRCPETESGGGQYE